MKHGLASPFLGVLCIFSSVLEVICQEKEISKKETENIVSAPRKILETTQVKSEEGKSIKPLVIALAKVNDPKDDSLQLSIKLTNTSNEILNLPVFGTQFDFEYLFSDSGGKPLGRLLRGGLWSVLFYNKFLPGRNVDYTVDLLKCFDLKPGSYSLRLKRSLWGYDDIKFNPANSNLFPGSTFDVESNEIKFVVTETKPMKIMNVKN